jgi:phenylpyruvate tautomerase PptA (4-oxalocrotonate tautomerase family)
VSAVPARATFRLKRRFPRPPQSCFTERMPWINLTLRRGTLPKETQHALMSDLTNALMFWEKIPDTPEARKFMKGWIYEVAEDADYNGGSPHHPAPFYFLEVRMPAGRLDTLARLGIMRDFTKLVLLAERKPFVPENATRVWVTIVDLEKENWGIGGTTDWLRSYTSALDTFPLELEKRLAER